MSGDLEDKSAFVVLSVCLCTNFISLGNFGYKNSEKIEVYKKLEKYLWTKHDLKKI